MITYIKKNKLTFILSTFLGVLASCATVGLAYIISDITNAVSDYNLNELYRILGISIIYLITTNILLFLFKYNKSKFIKKTVIEIRNDIFNGMLNLDINQYNFKNTAEYISILINDTNILRDSYLSKIFDLISNCALLVFAIIALCYISPVIALITITINIIPLIIPVIFSKTLSKLKCEYSNSLSVYTQKIKDLTSGFEVIKSFNIKHVAIKSHNKDLNDVEEANYKNNIFISLVEILANFSEYMIIILIFISSGYYIIKNQLNIGTLLAIVQLLNYIGNPIIIISGLTTEIKSTKEIRKKLSELTKIKELNHENKVSMEEFNSIIKFEDVSFSYDGEKKHLNNININFEKGKKYAIVGSSGSGKSTIIKLLLGYYHNYEGKITIDNINIKDIETKSLYDLISVIQQNVFMFNDTIKNNISLYGSYTEEQIINSLQKSGLDLIVSTLPNGIDSQIEENAKNFSGGEKQRFAIARSLIKETPILILDEATANIDNETSLQIEDTILNIEDLTVIVITHKLYPSILKRYDNILVINSGEICEQGDFYSLINSKGIFYSLYNVFN